MRFNCGMTFADRNKYLSEWHAWFAWYPVMIVSGDCRWLETVQRKATITVQGTLWKYKVFDLDGTGVW